MKINEMWNYEYKTNIWMLMLVFFNASAFNHMCWIIKEFTIFSENMVAEWTAYAAGYVITLTAFTMEFKRLNTKIEVSEQ